MPILNAIASLAVRDLHAASAWYASLLDKEADSRPLPEVAEWKFDRAAGCSCTSSPSAPAAAPSPWPSTISACWPRICSS